MPPLFAASSRPRWSCPARECLHGDRRPPSQLPAALSTPAGPATPLRQRRCGRIPSRDPSRRPRRADLPRPRLRVPRPHARTNRSRPRRGDRRDRRARAGEVAGADAEELRGRRARDLLRPASTWTKADNALRRAALDPRGRPELVVVNWQAPAARPFYTATPVAPQHVERRRRFRTEGRRLLDIADETFGETAGDEPRSLGDFLLEELERSRDEHMRDIVETIQADQYRLITHETEGVLVVQGGPGTGKTAVGLHRASWLLFTHAQPAAARGRARRRPEPDVHRVRLARPAVARRGERRPAGRSATSARRSSPEVRDEPDVERAQGRRGDGRARCARRSRRTAASRSGELEAMLGMNYVRVPLARVREIAEEAWEDAPSWDAARERLRMGLLRAFYRAYGDKLGASRRCARFEELEKALAKGGYLKGFVDAILPPLVPERVLVEALGLSRRPTAVDRGRRRAARRARRADPRPAEDVRPRDRGRGAGPDADAAADGRAARRDRLADAARRRRAVDRAGRRTSAGTRCSSTCPARRPTVEELVLAYRVPAEIMRLALPLLPRIAPHVRPPEAYREGRRAAALRPRRRTSRTAPPRRRSLLDAGEGSVAVVAPLALVPVIRELLERALVDVDGSPVEDLAPGRARARRARGEGPRVRPRRAGRAGGDRRTRSRASRAAATCTSRSRARRKTLTVVHSRPLPWG